MDIAKLGISIDSRDVRGATGDLRSFTLESDSAEMSVKRLGRTALASMGAFAAFSMLKQAAGHAMGFKAAMAEVSTLLDSQPGQMDALAKSARNLAKQYGTSATSQAQAYYQAISAGATSSADATRTLDAANRLAIGGVTDVTTGVDILTTAMNAYRAEGLTATAASDALFVGMRAGKTTISELSGSLGNIIPLARAMGVSFDEVVAGTSALTTQGIRTSEAVTGLRAALTAVTKPSQQAADLAEALGLKFDSQALAAKGLEGFLADVIEKTGGSSDAMATLFSSTEATTVALALAGGGSAKFSEILEDMKEKAGATATAFDKMSKDDLQRLNRALSTIADRALTFGQVVLTVAIPAIETLASNLNLLLGMATAASAVFATRLAVSVGATFVKSALAAVGQAIALEFALGATSKSAALASIATKGLSRSLAILKGAIAATGIGLFVIGAGYLVGKFLDLVEATGGWGNALKLLGEVAKGVWEGIVSSAEAIPVGLSAIWSSMQADFVGLLADLQSHWAKFLTAFHQEASDAGFDGLAKSFEGFANSAWESYDDLQKKTESLSSESAKLKAEAQRLAKQGFDQAKTAAKKLADAVSDTADELDDGEDTADAFASALGNLPQAADNAGSSLKKAADEAKGFHETLKDAVLTAEEFGKRKAEILVNGIDSVADAWGKFVANGFKDFKGFARSVLDSFKSMLAKMIAMAARNRIMISLGMGGGGSPLAASPGFGGGGGDILGGLTGGGGGGDILGSLTGSVGVGSALIGGFSNVVGATLSGGLGAGLTTIGAQLGVAMTGSLTAIAGAIGAIAAPLLAVVAVISFFRKKTKLLDAGLRVTVEGFDAAIETFKKIQISRFWGLSKKRRTDYKVADVEIADPIREAVSKVQLNVLEMAKVFSLSEDAFANFAATIEISTKGLTDKEISEEFQKQLGDISDSMADLVLVGSDFGKVGETSTETLTRLTDHLKGANSQFDMLALNLFDVSLAGADAASRFVDMFGTLERFNQFAGSYYQSFYSEQERLANAQADLEETMRSLGFSTVPETHAQFRMLVDAMNEMGNQEGLATLLQIAPAFNEIANASSNMAEVARDNAHAALQAAEQAAKSAYNNALRAIEAERSAVVDSWSAMLDELGAITTAARDRASAVMRSAGIILDAQQAAHEQSFKTLKAGYDSQIKAASKMAGHSRSVLSMLQDAIASRTGGTSEQMRRSQALELIGKGNTSDTEALERALSVLNEPSKNLHGSYVEYARDFAVTSSAIMKLRDSAKATLTTEEKILAGLESQLSAETAAYEAQKEYSDRQLEAMKAQLDLLSGIDNTLQGAITAIYGSGAQVGDVVRSATEISAGRILIGLASNDIAVQSASAMLATTVSAGNSGLMANLSQMSGVSVSAIQNLIAQVAAGDQRAGATLAQILGSSSQLASIVAASDSNNLSALSALTRTNASGSTGVGQVVQAAIEELADAAEQERIATEAAGAQISAADVLAQQQIEALNSSVSGILGLDQSIGSVTSAVELLDSSILRLTEAQIGVDVADQQLAEAVLREARIQNTLTMELLAIQQEVDRNRQLAALQLDLELLANEKTMTMPLLLEIVEEVGRGGNLFRDHASYVRLNDGQIFSSKTGHSTATELAHARHAAQQVIEPRREAYETWLEEKFEALEPLRKQILDLGGVPQFANGGVHDGGWRVVGERGWELEHTGQSRVVSNSDARDMLDNRAVIKELSELRRELREFKEDNRNGNVQIAKNTGKSAEIAKQNKYKAELGITS